MSDCNVVFLETKMCALLILVFFVNLSQMAIYITLHNP